MNFKKLFSLGIAAVMAVSAMSITAFAESAEYVDSSPTEIDYTIYDSDMEYIPEHAKIIEEYNKELQLTRATSYTMWNWNDGIYSFSMGKSSALTMSYYFVPMSNYIYFNVNVEGSTKQPYLTVNQYVSGSLKYVGSYKVTSNGDNSYTWENYKRAVNKGKNYVFALLNDTNWSSASIDINYESF